MQSHRAALVNTEDTAYVLGSTCNIAFITNISNIDVTAATSTTDNANKGTARDKATLVHHEVMDVGTVSNCANKATIVIDAFENKVADGMTLTVELANKHFYRNVISHVVAHVDVVCQAHANILMCVSIVAPPCKLCTIANIEPAINRSYEVFVKLSTDCAPAVHKCMRRYDCFARRIICITTFIQRCSIASEA